MKFDLPKVLVLVLLTNIATSAFGEISKPIEWKLGTEETTSSFTWGMYGLFSNEDSFTLEGGFLAQLIYNHSYGLFFDIGGYYSSNPIETNIIRKEIPSFLGFLGGKIGILCAIPIDESMAFTFRVQSIIIPQLFLNQPESIGTSFLRWGLAPGLLIDINENIGLGVEIREAGTANLYASFWLALTFDS